MLELLNECSDFEFLKANLGTDRLVLIEEILANCSDEPPSGADGNFYNIVVDWFIGNIDAEELIVGILSTDNSGTCIFDKFESIEIQNNTRLCEADAEFCIKQQTLYENVLTHYRNMYEGLIKLNQQDSDFNKSIAADNKYQSGNYDYSVYATEFFKFGADDFFKLIVATHDKFIKQINRYFRGKYKVTIEDKEALTYLSLKKPKEPELPYRYSSYTEEERAAHKIKVEEYQKANQQYMESITSSILHFDSMVDDIFLLLGAFTFEEQAEKEIKEDVLSAVLNRNGEPQYSLKNKKISFDILHSFKCSIFKRYEVSLDGKDYKSLLTALTYFDTDKKNPSIYSGWFGKFVDYKKTENDGIYETHDAGGYKIVSFKFFKNGKLEVEFIDHKTALAFAYEYLGYREG